MSFAPTEIMRILPALLATALMTVAGCTAATEEDVVTDEDGAALTAANTEYEEILAEVARVQDRCERESKCESDLKTVNLRPLMGQPGAATKGKSSIRAYTLCDALAPFADLDSPYFFVGASAKVAFFKSIAHAGVDMVFDLENQQAAAFKYNNQGYQNLIGVEASTYLGYGFGTKNNVLDAWSGEFQTAERTAEVVGVLGFLGLSVGGFIFRSPDNSIWGGAAEAGFGANALGPVKKLSGVELAVSEGFWTPWDSLTKAIGKTLYLVGYEEKSAVAVEEKRVRCGSVRLQARG